MRFSLSRALFIPVLFIPGLASLAIAFGALAAEPVAGPARAADAQSLDAAQLMQMLAQAPPPRARFVEKKYLSVLKSPLESSGELLFLPPDRLEKRTISPKPETLVLDGDTLTIERNQKKRSISLRSYPEVDALVGSIRSALAGDRERLARSYRVEVDGTRDRWRLVLLPSDPAIATLVSRLLMTGVRNRIESIETLQANGDRSVMTIQPVRD
jgi:outer membrane lipoprotein-sorting protein